MNNHKKKDDLADAFLQGFIMNFPVLPEHYASKIRTLYANEVLEENNKTKKKRVYRQYNKK